MAVELINRKLQRWVASTVWPRANDLTVWRQNWGSAVHSEDNIIHQTSPGNTILLFGCSRKWSDFSPHRVYLENRRVECFHTNIFMRLFNSYHCQERFDLFVYKRQRCTWFWIMFGCLFTEMCISCCILGEKVCFTRVKDEYDEVLDQELLQE